MNLIRSGVGLVALSISLVTAKAMALPILEYEYLGGGQDSSSTLSLDGDFYATKENEDSYNWFVSGAKSKSESNGSATGTTTGPSITDTTTSIDVGAGYKSAAALTVDVSLNYDNTPDETLTDHGPTLAIGKTWKLAPPSDKDFATRLNFKVLGGELSYIESFSTTRTRRRVSLPALPAKGENSINQYFVGASTYVKPSEWFRAKLDYKSYSYSKDVNSFLQYLDSQNRRAVGLNSAVSGFTENDFKLEFDFYYQDWELQISKDWTRVAADLSLTTTNKIILYRDLGEKWRVGLGAEHIASTSTEDPVAENELYLSVSYEF